MGLSKSFFWSLNSYPKPKSSLMWMVFFGFFLDSFFSYMQGNMPQLLSAAPVQWQGENCCAYTSKHTDLVAALSGNDLLETPTSHTSELGAALSARLLLLEQANQSQEKKTWTGKSIYFGTFEKRASLMQNRKFGVI